MKYFVISDTHSFYTETIKALNEKGYDQNNPDHTLILCGDAFDRGDESVKMFEWMKSLPKDRFVYIKGNHEDLLEECYRNIIEGRYIDFHHYSNGTVKTICDIISSHELYLPDSDCYNINNVKENVGKVLGFIKERCVDFFETKHYVFVHGWIPYQINPYLEYVYDKNWRHPAEYRLWDSRWKNGMEMCHYHNIRVPRKTTVCGHFHTSWARKNITGEIEEEFPENRFDKKLMYETFKPYEEEGIIAIDSCVAYSGFVNCIVLED